MTRAKEITKEAKKFAKEIDDWEIAEDVQDAFEQGALWADVNPNKDNMATAYKVGEAATIDKACEWLVRELCYTARATNLFNNISATQEFVSGFKKAMKQ